MCKRICLGFTNPFGTGVVCDVCLYFGYCGLVGVGGKWVRAWIRLCAGMMG